MMMNDVTPDRFMTMMMMFDFVGFLVDGSALRFAIAVVDLLIAPPRRMPGVGGRKSSVKL